MDSAQLIRASLAKTHVEKLIIFLSGEGAAAYHSATDRATIDTPRGAVATRVLAALLDNCRPSPSDLHDPDRTRVHARTARGEARVYYAAQTARLAGRRSPHRSRALRSPQTWDSARVPDYMALWCDRLLLGDHQRPLRCAVLEPRGAEGMVGESVVRVAQAHRRHLTRADILLVGASTELPFGILRQDGVALSDLGDGVRAAGALAGVPTLPQALATFPPPPQTAMAAARDSTSCASLLIGVGDAAGLRERFSAAEEARLESSLLPLASFTCALWAANPSRSASYVREQTPHPAHATAQTANRRLWATMQAAMLSTRDAALLGAHASGKLLDARLSPQQQEYLAETLLSRLRERDGQP